MNFFDELPGGHPAVSRKSFRPGHPVRAPPGVHGGQVVPGIHAIQARVRPQQRRRLIKETAKYKELFF